MAALLIVQATVLEREAYKRYQAAVQPLVASFGGKLSASGVGLEVLEGSHDGRRLVIFEFPSMDAIQGFWNSPEYKEVKKLREGAARIDAWAARGT
ncbi:MAG TPA: DUF1330 domain-containing protein [Burkholderiales bacterium]|nr:DUF1330 domain-containing protein [Burkholderiales bacterium]